MKNLDKQFNLPTYIKGKSFADASKAIDKKFADRHDQASVDTKNDLMNRLMQAQEAYNKENNPQQQSANTEQAYGGNNKYAIGGMLLGAGVNMLTKYIGNKKQERQQEAQEQELAQNNVNSNIMQANLANSEFDDGGSTEPKSKATNASHGTIGANQMATFNSLNLNSNVLQNSLLGGASFGQKLGAYARKAGEFIGENGATGLAQGLRLLGPLGNKKQLNELEKPKPIRLDRTSNAFREQRVDKAGMQAIAQNQMGNTMRSLKDATGGSQGAYRANLLGANANQLDALSRQFMAADQANIQQKNMRDRNQTAVDRLNLGQSNMEMDINDRNLGAYLTNKSKLQAGINDDFGSMGREWLDRIAARKTTGYTSGGRYVGNK